MVRAPSPAVTAPARSRRRRLPSPSTRPGTSPRLSRSSSPALRRKLPFLRPPFLDCVSSSRLFVGHHQRRARGGGGSATTRGCIEAGDGGFSPEAAGDAHFMEKGMEYVKLVKTKTLHPLLSMGRWIGPDRRTTELLDLGAKPARELSRAARCRNSLWLSQLSLEFGLYTPFQSGSAPKGWGDPCPLPLCGRRPGSKGGLLQPGGGGNRIPLSLLLDHPWPGSENKKAEWLTSSHATRPVQARQAVVVCDCSRRRRRRRTGPCESGSGLCPDQLPGV